MYSISDEAKQILNSRIRQGFKARITMHDGTVFNNDLIESIDWSDGIIMDDHFEIGTATMAQATVKIMLNDNALGYAFEGKELFAEIGITLSNGNVEYIPLGYFTVEKAPHDNDYDVTLTCSDRMYKLETLYNTAATYPATLLQIAQDICNEADVELQNTSFVNSDYIVTTKPTLKSDLTCRKAIMAIAELAGGYAHINRAGKLEIINANADINNEIKYASDSSNIRSDGWLIYDELITGSATITRDNYSTIVSKEQPINKIDGITIGALSKGICDYPLAINESNIFLQDPTKVIDNLYNALKDFSYQPFTMTWQGNPAIDCGDKLTILGRNGSQFNTIATSRTMSFNGGLSEDYTSVGKTANEQDSTPAGDTDIKIADTKDDLQQYTDNAVDKLAGNKGGYIYLRRNDDGTPSEIFIMDSPSPTTAKNCLRINKEGVGGSTNGINGPFNFSCLIDGSINATMVTTGTMIADRIKGGTLTLGGLNNEYGSLIIVDKDGNQIGTWDKNGINLKTIGINSSIHLHDGYLDLLIDDKCKIRIGVSNYGGFLIPSIILGEGADGDISTIKSFIGASQMNNESGQDGVKLIFGAPYGLSIGTSDLESSNGYTSQGGQIDINPTTMIFSSPFISTSDKFKFGDSKGAISKDDEDGINIEQNGYKTTFGVSTDGSLTVNSTKTYSGTVTISGMQMTFQDGLLVSAQQI